MTVKRTEAQKARLALAYMEAADEYCGQDYARDIGVSAKTLMQWAQKLYPDQYRKRYGDFKAGRAAKAPGPALQSFLTSTTRKP